MEYITGKDLYEMFHYGSVHIVKKRKKLNDINVFPVADKDTGNNLASTLQAIASNSQKDVSFHYALESISESALFGARGNSGVIFAQFVNGLRVASKGKEKVTIEEFAMMVNQSVEYTYASLSNPVEGTMLTVIKDWANSLIDIVKKNLTSIKSVFEHALNFAKKSLESTKEKLQALKKANVVDSGAMGFVLFLEGINSYYNNEEIERIDYDAIEIDEHEEHIEENINYRYCTEGLVRITGTFDKEDLKQTLEQYGDSLIIARGLDIFRVHIHTNEPHKIFQILSLYGKVLNQKVDNMILDINLENSKNKTVIVTDSIGDLDQSIIDDFNVVVVPIYITVNEVEYFDKLTMNNDILFDLIPKSKEYPTTSMPSITTVNKLFKRLMNKFDNMILITVSSKLSATHKILKTEALKFESDNKNIYVIDSLNNSATEGLLVKKAVDMLNEGFKPDEIYQALETAKKKTNILVCLNTFKYAMMGGRLPKIVGKVGNFLGLRPIMTLDKEGNGAAFSMALSKKQITKMIKKIVIKEMEKNGIESYGLVHCINPDLVKEYDDLFTEIIGKRPEFITEVSSAVAIHSGVGTVAIGYIRK